MFGLRKQEDQIRTKKYRIRYPAKAGYRNDTKIYFKSKMEANVYRYLKTKNFDTVEYEPDLLYFKPNRFQIKGYVPDFKVSFGKRFYYIEVKGFMEKSDYQKIALVQRDYPWIKLYYINSEKYNLIKKFYSKQIRHWEWYIII